MVRLTLAAVMVLSVAQPLSAQPPGGRGGQPPRSPKDAAPVDLTGYWVSVVTEDWRWRMVTPAKGDFAGVPLNAEGRALGRTWDPAKDEAAGAQCKAYGAPAIMRQPGRLHITWQDEHTLRIDTDYGTQTRLFHFGGTRPAGSEHVQAHAGDDRRQPATQVVHLARVGPGDPDPRVLQGVVGFAERAEHAVGHGPQPRPMVLEPGCQPLAVVHSVTFSSFGVSTG